MCFRRLLQTSTHRYSFKLCAENRIWAGIIGTVITALIIKITISLILIGLKNSYFPLIHMPSCYRTVCYRTACYRTVQQINQIQSCRLNQPITFKVVV